MNVLLTLVLITGTILGIQSCSHTVSKKEPAPVVVEEDKPDIKPALITTTSDDAVLLEAIGEAIDCIRNPELAEVVAQQNFLFTDLSGAEVADKFANASDVVTVEFRKHWNPWSSEIARRDGERIILNTRAHPRPKEAVFATLVHEYSHVLGFTHPFYYSKERDQSVPYKIERIAEAICLAR